MAKSVRWVAALAGLALVLLIASRLGGELIPDFLEWVAEMGPLAPLMFVLGFAAGAIALVPASIFILAGGALFGVLRGTAFAVIAQVLGGSLAFLIARYVARRKLTPLLSRDRRLSRVDRMIGRSGLRVVTLLRLSPAVPFPLASYSLGLTSVRFKDYLLGMIGVVPPTWLYAYYGKMLGNVVNRGAGPTLRDGPGAVVLGAGLVATVVVTVWLTRLVDRALKADPNPESG